MAKSIYSDVDMGLRRDITGDVRIVHDMDAINQSIKTILTTTPGERFNQPLFGSYLKQIVFQPLDSITAATIEVEIEEAIIVWEPRVTIRRINVTPDYDNNAFNVEIHYHVRDSGAMGNYSASVPSLG